MDRDVPLEGGSEEGFSTADEVLIMSLLSCKASVTLGTGQTRCLIPAHPACLWSRECTHSANVDVEANALSGLNSFLGLHPVVRAASKGGIQA